MGLEVCLARTAEEAAMTAKVDTRLRDARLKAAENIKESRPRGVGVGIIY